MSTESSSSTSDSGQPLFLGGSKMPPLPPGYHFIISLCDVVCTREQIDAIHEDLVEVARAIIREYELRTAGGRFANARVHINRTVPLLDEDLSDQEREVRTENLQGPIEEAGGDEPKLAMDSGVSPDAAAEQ
jgi:hypothetical protein